MMVGLGADSRGQDPQNPRQMMVLEPRQKKKAYAPTINAANLTVSMQNGALSAERPLLTIASSAEGT